LRLFEEFNAAVLTFSIFMLEVEVVDLVSALLIKKAVKPELIIIDAAIIVFFMALDFFELVK
jgi:hypothetical protein